MKGWKAAKKGSKRTQFGDEVPSIRIGLYCEIISLVKVSFLLNYELKYHPNILCNAGKLNARVN